MPLRKIKQDKKLAIRALIGFQITMVFVLTAMSVLAYTNVKTTNGALFILMFGILASIASILLSLKEKYTASKFLIILVPPYTVLFASVWLKSHGLFANVYTFLTPKFFCILFLMTPVIFFGVRYYKKMLLGFLLLLPVTLCFDCIHKMAGVDIAHLPYIHNFYPIFISVFFVFYAFSMLTILLAQKTNLLYKKGIETQNEIIQQEKEEIEHLNRDLRFQANLYRVLEITSSHDDLKIIMQRVLDEVLKIDDIAIEKKGLIFLTNITGDLELVAHNNVGILLKTCSIIKEGECLCGLVLKKKESFFCNKVDHYHTIKPDGIKPHGHYVTPIKYDDEVLGVLNFYIKAGQPKDEKIESFLASIAIILARKIKSRQQKTALKEQAEVIAQKRDKLKEVLDELNQSIAYAKRLQHSLMPDDITLNKFLEDAAVLYEAKDSVSGDFYFTYEIENKLFFGVGDCTGHGIPGSMLAFMSLEAVKYIVEQPKCQYPNQVLEELRKVSKKRFSVNEKDKHTDSMDAGICMYDKTTKKLYFSGGFIDLFIVRNNKEVIEIKGTKCPVGEYPVELPFELHEVDLQIGDVLYLSTDGYYDQFGYLDDNSKPTKFKRKRFKDLLIKISSLDSRKQIEELKNTLNVWRKNLEQTDDVTVFVIKHNT